MLKILQNPFTMMGVGFSTILFLISVQIASSEHHFQYRNGFNLPCHFKDTVNLTGDVNFSNGSYFHAGVLIPAHLVGVFDYVQKGVSHRVRVKPHLRGCICNLKPCISFCCPWGTINNNETQCVKTPEDMQWPEKKINITLKDDTLETVDIFEQFVVQEYRPCENMYSLQPEQTEYDQWKLFKNGTILRVDDEAYLTKDEYCFVPTLSNGTLDKLYNINPANCDVSTVFGTMKIINAYAMLFSIPFMVLTIIVYLSIPELCNQHGKSLVCYLSGLIIGYSLLSGVSLQGTNHFTIISCKLIGYTAYYFFMAAFLWLSVISFDLWHNFRGTRGINRLQENKRFFVYSLYAWGLPAIFLLLTVLAQEVMDIPNSYKPGIGGGEFCWLDMRTWSAMIYFFNPIILIIIANIAMFLMTAIKIHTVQREMARIMAREDSTRNLRTEKDKFGLFLRLFIVMGVTWSLEILSYFLGSDEGWAKFFYVSDMCNAIQGFLIFMLFVMKKKVKLLITNRILKRKSPGSSHTNSTNSTSSNINPKPANFAMKPQSSKEKMKHLKF